MRKELLAALAATLIVAGCGGAKAPDTKSPAGGTSQPSGNGGTSGQNGQPGQPAPNNPPQGQTGSQKRWSAPPALQIDLNRQYFATLKTSMGDIRIEFFTKDAPKTVNNFIFLAREHFYDGVIFHRIIKNFMIQGGDPLGNGGGSPGYRFNDELPPKRSYDPGIVAMANSGPNTNGSQFFICNGPNCKLSLDAKPDYTQFGKVVAGMDVVLKISSVPTGANDRPIQPPVIASVTIEEK